MATITPFPLGNIDMQLGEVRALLDTLISIGENAEDEEFLRLRASTVSLLYIATDKLKSADRSVPHLYRREAL